MHKQVTEVAKYWPDATRKTGRKQALKLLKAKRYLIQRGLMAHKVGSKFEYNAGPTVLKGN